MMERKNGMRLPAVVLLAALAFSCFAPAALATAEEPPEDLPAAVSAQDGAQEETTLPGADAAQQDTASPRPGGPCAASRRWRAERKWFDQFDRFFFL